MAALKTCGRVGGPGLEKGEGRVWGHQDTLDVGAWCQRAVRYNWSGLAGDGGPVGRRGGGGPGRH